MIHGGEDERAMPTMRRLISPRFHHDLAVIPASIHPAQVPFIRAIHTRIAAGEYGLASAPCPCGGAPADVIIAETERHGLPLSSVLCLGCGSVRFDPYLDRESLDAFYATTYQDMYRRASDPEEYLQRQGTYGRRVLLAVRHLLRPGDRVVEVGCGAGGGLRAFADAGYNVAGCDHSSALLDVGRRHGLLNLFAGSLIELEAGLAGVTADLIYLHHVFEHIHDPFRFLTQCRSLLSPRGSIVIVVPDISRIHAFPTPAGDLLQFLHLAHRSNFSLAGLTALSARAGYRCSRLPAPKLHTPWSEMPELWARIAPGPGDVERPTGRDPARGLAMLNYLRRTERLHTLGLCPGQLVMTRRRARARLSRALGHPSARVRAWVRSIIRSGGRHDTR
jgi:SAM-dependent methyltransferase